MRRRKSTTGDNETDMVYLDADAFDKGTVILKPDSGETYTLSETGRPARGLQHQQRIRPSLSRCRSSVRTRSTISWRPAATTGLSNYDHIALDGSDIHEDEIVIL